MTICPHCGLSIDCHDIYCPYCKKKVKSYFSISYFLKENFHLFAIIGVIGTMISVLPNLGEKLIGPEWVSGYLGSGIYLASAILFGCLFLLGIYAITIRHIWVDCRKEEADNKVWIFPIKIGDKFRFLLTIALSAMLLPFIYYILLSTLSFPDIYAQFTIAVLFLFLSISWLIYVIYDLLCQIWYDIKHDRLESLVIITLFLITMGIVVPSVMQEINPPNPQPLLPSNVTIQPDISYFSPLISSNKGIKLYATNTSSPKFITCVYHWKTNYGYFFEYRKSSGYARILGDETNWSNSIFWSFPPSDIEKEKPSVTITLDILDCSNQSYVTNTTINITWLNNEIAQI